MKETTAELGGLSTAVVGGETARFSIEVDEEAVPTLLKIDTVSLADPISEQLRANIEREGVVIYDQN